MKYKFRRYYLYYLGRVLAFILSLIPLRAGLYIARIFGILAFLVLGKYRRLTEENLRKAFGSENSLVVRT